jgi:recombinational DNA repair ATPase RecF
MVLGATQTAQAVLGRPLLLLLDDPAAELDAGSLQRLMTAVAGLKCQVVATSLNPEALTLPQQPALFHVEHGRVSAQP